jgi:hypothetical protein
MANLSTYYHAPAEAAATGDLGSKALILAVWRRNWTQLDQSERDEVRPGRRRVFPTGKGLDPKPGSLARLYGRAVKCYTGPWGRTGIGSVRGRFRHSVDLEVLVKYAKGLETKLNILEACKDLFYDKGYRKATYIDIYQLIKAHPGSIKYYF